MTGGKGERRRIIELLPFLANDTLEGEERDEVEAAVAADPDLAEELESLRRLRADVKRRAPPSPPGELGLARTLKAISEQQAAGAPARKLRFWRAAAVAAIFLVTLQAAVIWSSPQTIVRLAGGDDAGEGPTLTVAFVETAPEGVIRALLQDLDLQIVSGPSALGLYTLGAKDPSAADRAVERLSEEPDIVESIERD